MQWAVNGQWVPIDDGGCLSTCHLCMAVCPFQDHKENEDTLAAAHYGSIEAIQHTPETGYYFNAYAGHANGQYRERGASGGMASWFLAALLEKGTVDHVICVRPKADAECLFEFAVFSTAEEVRGGAKSAYYPVELSNVLRHIMENDGRYAVMALPCFAKAIRLASHRIPLLRRRIAVLAGLVCGQMKSKYFADYLIRHMGLDPLEVTRLSFRSKNPNRPASNFEIQAQTRNGRQGVCESRDIFAQTWCSGMFTPRACTFCDDIFAETADIAFMDAWLPEYAEDSRGTSIVLIRSQTARQLIEDGIKQETITMRTISIEKVITSQAGVVEQKNSKLTNRLWMAGKKGFYLRKRIAPVRPSWFQRLLLDVREDMRKTSQEAYGIARISGTRILFEFAARMQSPQRRWNALLLVANCIIYARVAISRFIHFWIPR